jgi:hypothetical protein
MRVGKGTLAARDDLLEGNRFLVGLILGYVGVQRLETTPGLRPGMGQFSP